jgi:hypothetical protein
MKLKEYFGLLSKTTQCSSRLYAPFLFQFFERKFKFKIMIFL